MPRRTIWLTDEAETAIADWARTRKISFSEAVRRMIAIAALTELELALEGKVVVPAR